MMQERIWIASHMYYNYTSIYVRVCIYFVMYTFQVHLRLHSCTACTWRLLVYTGMHSYCRTLSLISGT